MITLYVNGNVVPKEDYTGLEDISVSYSFVGRDQSVSLGNEIEFYGDTKEYLLDELERAMPPRPVNVLIKKQIGTNIITIFEGKISDDYSFCVGNSLNEDCGLKCKLLDSSIRSVQMDCLRSRLLTERSYNGIDTQGEDIGENAILGYYDESRPKLFSYLMMYLTLYVLVSANTFLLLIRVATLGIADIFIDFGRIQNEISQLFIKPRYHKAVFLANYIKNVCTLCGIQNIRYTSTEVADFFNRCTRLDMPSEEGAEDYNDLAEINRIFKDFNSPNITFEQLMESLEPLNISYMLSDTGLVVGRKDELFNDVWIDFTVREPLKQPCYTNTKESVPASDKVSYIADALDGVGNEALETGFYKEIHGYGTLLDNKGVKETILSYSPIRVIGDHKTSIIKKFLNSWVYNLFPRVEPIKNGFLLLQRGVSGLPKLIYIDTSSPLSQAEVEKPNTGANGTNTYYNSKAFVSEDLKNAPYNFYTKFISINNPLNSNMKWKNKTFEVTFQFECSDIEDLQVNKYVRLYFLDNDIVVGTVDNLDIDFSNQTITIKGKV